MKAIIGNAINYTQETEDSVCVEFVQILNSILESKNENQLRYEMDVDWINFKYGFGSHHMWVKQIDNGELSERILLVEF